ncbi:hypothetical protein LRP67_10805 [Nocardioides sp. cx-169]|uniref:hypothetical protein n=1 Tax=Nocardioides sp. cx-169 TaxID=2899080 RepID=UPI001E5EA056|nr:hypothetical protein [Nocardioides sp. cx-169]MCD4534573.1 hypothetical protein [Nocardioides sp. cx-169]
MRLRRSRPDLAVEPGERLLAWAVGVDGQAVGGTRQALYLGERRIPWEGVEAAEWDRDTSVLRVSEVGTWGQERPTHRIVLDEPGRLLELVRERVTASIVLQRHVAVRGRKGVRVIARRAPHSRGEIAWLLEYDAGIDPDDPLVREASERALADAADEVHLG